LTNFDKLLIVLKRANFMTKLAFKDLEFHETNGIVRAYFLRNFYFDINKEELALIGKFKIGKNSISFEEKEQTARRKFNFLLEKGLSQLISLQGKPATFVHKDLLPLIGSLYFGLIDRGTNIIEVRPVTGCNLDCIFCSVDLSRRVRDFVVQTDYLVREFRKLVKLKLEAVDSVEAHLNAQGETLFYGPIAELVKGIAETKGVNTISLDTNGCLLTEKKIDALVKAGLTRFNISLNSLNQATATKLANASYPLKHVVDMCKYAAKKADLLIAPVWLHGINDKDIEDIIKFALSLNKKQSVPLIGIQNFLEYKYGKRPVKQKSWQELYSWLGKLEQKYKTKLILSRKDFNIEKAKVLDKPFRKDDKVRAEIVCPGKFPNEKLAQADDRIISLPSCSKEKGSIRIKITRDKYNIFYGRPS